VRAAWECAPSGCQSCGRWSDDKTNMYHLAVACKEVRVWHEYVPSKANIADIQSRPGHRDWHALAAMGIEEFVKEMVFPPAAAWEDYMEIARLLGRA
jgi:hypothetical protein